LQDRSFEPTVFNVPDYIREDSIYHGGVAKQYDVPGEGKSVAVGWVARVWDPAVRERYRLLIEKLAAEFDGKIYGINLPETAVDFDEKNYPEDFSFDKYFYAELNNIKMVRKAFRKSIVLQYVNFGTIFFKPDSSAIEFRVFYGMTGLIKIDLKLLLIAWKLYPRAQRFWHQ